MMHGMSISYLCLVASSLARVSFGDTLEAKLPHPAIVDLLDRNDVAVDMAIPKGVERPGIATKQNGNANRTRSMAEPWPLSDCFNSASVSDLPFTRAYSISRSVDSRDWEALSLVVIVNC